MAKAWLRERWKTLIPELVALSIDQEEEIARICAVEILAWKERPSMKSLSSLKEPMTDTRNEIKKIPLTDQNSYLNSRTQQHEHIALKYLNYSESEWAEMNQQSEQRYHERQENQQLLDHPDQIVAMADQLLGSTKWTDVVVGLAVITGRRLSEILKTGELHPKTRYTVMFSGQLKRKDEVLKPYEIPVLVEANRVLAAWSGLRKMIDCSHMETEAIGKAYGTEIGEAAALHFTDLVPVRDGRDKLFAHLFRAVYPRLAIFYFCPVSVTDIAYVSTILGHYWSATGDEAQQRNYSSSLHYNDYRIGDGAGNIDGRQGIRVGESGVEVLEVFKPKPAAVAGSRQKGQTKIVDLLEARKKHSATQLSQETKSRLDQMQKDLNVRTQDEAMSAAIDSHYMLQQILLFVQPTYEWLGVNDPIGVVQVLVDGVAQLQKFNVSLREVTDLLEDASECATDDKPYQAEYARALAVIEGKASDGAKEASSLQKTLRNALKEKGKDASNTMPALYLESLMTAKRDFHRSYEKRHEGKDYSTMSLTDLRNTKMPGAATERFKRAIAAIMAYNEQAAIPDLRWYINAAVVTELVGGRPSDAKEYLATRQAEIDVHHQKYGLTAGYNRRPVKITARVTVPEKPVVEEVKPEVESGEVVQEEVNSEEAAQAE